MSDTILCSNETEALSLCKATVDRIDENGACWIALVDRELGPVRANLAGAIAERPDVLSEGTLVLVARNGADELPPIILDVVAERLNKEDAEREAMLPSDEPVSAWIDGKEVFIEGQREITLRCGRASLTLQRNGKIVLKGDHILSYSRGTNRIKGGSVKIN